MSIFLKKNIHPKGQIGLWRIEEPEQFFFNELTLSSSHHQQLQKKHPSKRLEWLASRFLLHQMSNGDICETDDKGKPFLKYSSSQISISHSGEFAAVALHPHQTIGIDIQKITPRIKKIAHKFMREEEKNSLQHQHTLEHLHVYWGAKEALYKAYGKKELDFRGHIHIEPFDYQQGGGQTFGKVKKGNFLAQFNIIYEHLRDYILVYAVEKH